MSTKRKKQIAVVLIIVPILVGYVMRRLGSDAFIIEWQGSLSSPKSVQFEFHDFGAVLMATSLVGVVWLVYVVCRGLFSKSSPDDRTA